MSWQPPPASLREEGALTIDARHWHPPEPFVQTVQALDQLKPGQWVRLLLHRYPYPLLDALTEWQWQYAVHEHDDGTVEIHIWRP